MVSRDYYPLGGGLDLVSTSVNINPGALLGVLNYEPGIEGGYSRIEGYERFDGQTAPSDATYVQLDFDAGVSANYPSVGDTVTGATSTHTGVVLAIIDNADTTGTLILARHSGTFTDDEDLQVSAVTFGAANGVVSTTEVSSDTDHQNYTNLAADDARALISAVPGSGDLRGVWMYNGVVYAFRDNAGATAVDMYKSSSSGWTLVTLNDKIDFDAGTGTEPAEGATVTGATSGASAVIKRIVTQSGTWGVDAAGYIILGTVSSGPFQNNENLQVSAATIATADGANSTQTLPVGGRYEFRSNNFRGHENSFSMYGVNGVGNAFEYNDTDESFTLIETGMTEDKPDHLAIQDDVLYLSFRGGSIQNSAVGDPLSWTVSLGASEFAIGGSVTGLLEEVGKSLFIFSRAETYVKSGAPGASDETLEKFSRETGAHEWSLQRIGRGFYFDDRGFTNLTAVERFGNYRASSFSKAIQPLTEKLRKVATVVSSHVSRRKNLYRCSFSDGRNIVVGLQNERITGFTVTNYGFTVLVPISEEDSSGTERIFCGDSNGFVYELDKGTSMDGDDIEYYLRTAFHYSRRPTMQKRYRKARYEIQTESATVDLKAGPTVSFGISDAPSQATSTLSVAGGGGYWDEDNWDEFRWSASVYSSPASKLNLTGVNISFSFSGASDEQKPHTIQGIDLHWSPRRLERGTTL